MQRAVSTIVLVGITILMCGGSIQPAPEPPEQPLEQLKWLSGSWVMTKGDLVAEEHWTEPRAGTMFGIGRTMKGDRTVFFEYLRIEQTPDGIVYFASPRGRDPATPFAALEIAPDKVVFENPEHDFPTRIIYWREADGGIGARIEGVRNGREASETWIFQPQARQ